MCDGMREPPRPGTELYTYWREQPFPVIHEERDITIGDWTLRVRILKVKESKYMKDANVRHVSMTVIG